MALSWPVMHPQSSLPAAGTVLCWRICVDDISAQGERALAQLLPSDEQAQADRFQRAADRLSFTAAHAALRLLLAAVLACPPREIAISRSNRGKPMLPGSTLEFNLSHTADIVLIAMTLGTPIGVDVEKLHTLSDREAIIRRFFHTGEAADLAPLSGSIAETAFFQCWTRKEAVAKALGLGLALPLNSYRVSCRPQDNARLLELSGAGPPVTQWSLVDLIPGPGYVGALALPISPITLSLRTLQLGQLV